MSHELFLLRLVQLLPILIGLIQPLVAGENQHRQHPYSFSPEKVLEVFFKDLFENTTAGYVLYGQKPVDLEIILPREKTIPGTQERRSAVIGLFGLQYWNEINPKSKNYLLLDFEKPDHHEVTLINRKAFLEIVKTNSLLFEYKFGNSIDPSDLLASLIQNGFSALFKESIALQGIVLGYGVDNSISYECGISLLKEMVPQTSPPNQLPPTSKTPEEVLQKIKNKSWAKNLQELTCYKSAEKNDRVKIPFSFLKNSNQSKKLLQSYRKYQTNLESALNQKNFLLLVLQKFGTKLNPSFSQKYSSYELADFFTPTERTHLSQLVGQTIKHTFSNEISPAFIQGMKDAELGKPIEPSNVKFLDVLWKRDPSMLQATNDFFAQLSNEKTVCLIPQKLYIRTQKETESNKVLTKNHDAIKVKYLITDLENHPLVGSYELQETATLYLRNLIPGLAHGLLGMKEGEIREVFIHPDFVYGTSSAFGKGQAVKAIVELIDLDITKENSTFPQLQPIDVLNYAPAISSCAEFVEFQRQHAYSCGFRSWNFYKKATPLISLESVLNEMSKGTKTPLAEENSNLLLKLEWLILQG